MRRKFQLWLFVFVAVAFVVSFVTYFGIQTWQARTNATALIEQRMQDVRRRIDSCVQDEAVARTLSDEGALYKARALAEILARDPGVLSRQRRLDELARVLGVDELHISDEHGIVVACVPARYVGYDMATSEQSAAFLPALKYPHFKLVQEPRKRGFNGQQLFQFAGVARKDRPGIVQIGYVPDRLKKAMNLSSESTIADGLTVGSSGGVVACRGGEIVSSSFEGLTGKPAAAFAPSSAARSIGGGSRIATINATEYVYRSAVYKDYTLVGALPTSEMYVHRDSASRGLVFFNVILFIVVFVLVSLLVQRVVISGILKIKETLSLITKGDLQERVEVRTSPEFTELSDGINSTVDALKVAIAEADARLDAELALARDIQMGSLITAFPAFPDRSDFDLYAGMQPAKEVGGDFYDFLLLNERYLAAIVADVSGKGVPAAMLMMRARSVISGLARQGMALEEVFRKANNELCKGNDMDMFVTAFLVVLDTATGELRYVNAGHNPAVVLRATGSVELLASKSGFVLAGMEGMSYKPFEARLDRDDVLVLYTDGVTEALNPQDEFFEMDRTLQVLRRNAERGVREIVTAVEDELSRFRGEAEQADDITLLALRYRGTRGVSRAGSSSGRVLNLKAQVDDLDRLLDFINSFLEEYDCSPAAQVQLNLAAEEIFANIVHYAYAADVDFASRYVRVELFVDGSRREGEPAEFATVTLCDGGTPYNPLHRADPDTTLGAEEREVGGLGIFMVKRSVDEVSYAYEAGENRLTMRKRI